MRGICPHKLLYRWCNQLDPSIITSDWTANEVELMAKMHAQIGNKWAVIASQLPGR